MRNEMPVILPKLMSKKKLHKTYNSKNIVYKRGHKTFFFFYK